MRKYHILFSFFIFLVFSPGLGAQERKVTFGLQFEPLVPSGLIRSSNVSSFRPGVQFSTDPKPGYAYGAHVSFRLNRRMAIETGINHLIRDYRIRATEEDFEVDLEFTADNFEIPLTFNYFIRLGEKLYMDQSLGFSFQFLPVEFQSRVFEETSPGSTTYLYDFSQISVRNYWVMPVFRGGFGIEYRTEKNGGFYIGPVYRLFSTLYYTRILYTHGDININDLTIEPTGDYFGITFRYIFPL
ncbi:MAG: hypothetical protein EOM06_04070 [Sphingobacteriia bacterium]|nr:hypothetical protein [Sphingobacteriia bacterium]